MSILEALWGGGVRPCDRTVKQGSEYDIVRKEASKSVRKKEKKEASRSVRKEEKKEASSLVRKEAKPLASPRL